MLMALTLTLFVHSMLGGVARRFRFLRRDFIGHRRRRRLLQPHSRRAAGDAERPGRHAAGLRPPTPGQRRRRVGPGSRRHRQLRRIHAAALSPGTRRRDSALQVDAGFLRLRQ